jgi:tRNA-splicing ligase RtcB (3'-phosphate/5'-hydroxy nucleic acid ligase)
VRGTDQLGTLGSGNHFLEVQRVAKIIDPQATEGFSLRHDQVTVLIHSGSRGFGRLVCGDYYYGRWTLCSRFR